MERVSVFGWCVAKTAIHRYAIEKGHTIISNSVVDAAVGHILPKGAMEAMKQLGATLDAQGIDRNTMKADDGVARDMLGSTLSGMMSGIVEEKPAVSPGTQAYLDRMSQNYWLCGGCGHTAEGRQPGIFPLSGGARGKITPIAKSKFQAGGQTQGDVRTQLGLHPLPLGLTQQAQDAHGAGRVHARLHASLDREARREDRRDDHHL